MKSASLGNRPVQLDGTSANNQVFPIDKKRKIATVQSDSPGAIQCSSGACQAAWKPAQVVQADNQD